MDRATQTYEGSRELADLRRRAYGPDADIQRDPDALRRLHELEELARPLAPTPSDAPSEPEVRGAAAAAASVPSPAAETASRASDASAAQRPRWWRSGALWAVAGMSLVLGVAVGAAALALAAPSSGDGPDLTLEVVEQNAEQGTGWVENLHYWGVVPGSVVQYEPYDTIEVWTGSTATAGRCVLLSHNDRVFTATCTSGNLDPVLDLVVNEGWPVRFEEQLPPGSVIRFIARPTAIDVWVRPEAPTLSGFGE